MLTLKEWLETCEYRITEGSEYGWQCYGHNAYRLDSWNGDQDGHTISIVFDTRTQVVYEASAYDYTRERAYRMINPEFKAAFDAEVVDRELLDMAWEDDEGNPVKYIELETAEDFMEKAYAICNDQDYDSRVQVPITLEDDVLFRLMKHAHEQDITLNQLFENILQNEINRLKEGV